MLNRITIMGRVVNDLELKNTTGNSYPVVSFRIATQRNYKENNEYPVDFYDVVAWRKTAEFICQYFGKGHLIAIDGKLQTRKYTDKNNAERTVVEILVDNAHFCESKKDNAQGAATYNGAPTPPHKYAGAPSFTPYPNAAPIDMEFNGTPPDDFYPEF